MAFASFRERLSDFRFYWIVLIHVVLGRPGGLLQFSEGDAVKILASVSSRFSCNIAKQGETLAKRYDCLLVSLTSLFRTWWYHLFSSSFHRLRWLWESVLV